MADETNWLEMCVPWDGKEQHLPRGANTPNGVSITALMKSWDVMDAEADSGFKTVKTADLQPGMVIVGATPNNNSILKIIQTYGSSAFQFENATGQKCTPEKWVEMEKTNPFTLLAVMRMMVKLNGKGVRF
jgi:hypothetical protein